MWQVPSKAAISSQKYTLLGIGNLYYYPGTWQCYKLVFVELHNKDLHKVRPVTFLCNL